LRHHHHQKLLLLLPDVGQSGDKDMGLKEVLNTTSVSEMNLRPPVTISIKATVREAVGKMRAAGLGCVIAVDGDDRAVGIFTEAMLRHALNESVEILDDALENQIVARLPWVHPTDEVAMVLEAMEEYNIRFIAVLDEDRHVVGITGQKTVMEFIAEIFPYEVMTQDTTGHSASLRKEGA
jgi:CBS domain-containing protein